MLDLMKMLPSVLALLGKEGGLMNQPIKVFLDLVSMLPKQKLEEKIVPIDVKKAQDRLTVLGFEPGPVDGWPGEMTMAAVKKFQESKGLVVDGYIGQQTYRALMQA
jgi:Putative peptidoglycan binding domain